MTVSMIGDNLISNRSDGHRRDPFDRPEPPERSVIGPRELYGLLHRRFLLIAAIVCVGTLAAATAAYTLPKSYSARSMILLEPDDPNLLEDQPDTQTRPPSHETLDTESDLIKSRSFAGRVVDDLQLVKDPDFNPYLPKTAADGSAEPAQASGILGSVVAFFGGEGERTNASVPSADVQRDQAISILLSKLSTVRNGESMALTVSVTHGDAEMAAKLANAITGQFVEWSRDQKRDDIRNATAFLRQQSSDLAASIASKELEISEYSSRLNVSIDPRDDLLRLAMQQTNEQLSNARGDYTQAQARLEQVQGDVSGAAAGTDPLLKSEFLTTLRNEEASAQRDRAQLARNYGENHPLIQDADAKIASVRKLISGEMNDIVANLRNDVSVAQERITKLESDLAGLNKELRRRSVDEIRLRELNRDLMTEQKLYDLISSRLGKLDPYSDAADPGARVISYAEVPREPAFPKPRMMTAGALAGSVVLAFIIALTIEGADSRVHNAKHLASILQAPVMGIVPRMRSRFFGRPVNVASRLSSSRRSRVGEAFHTLCNASRRSYPGTRAFVVMVSSASPAEGRTTTAIGFACAAALQGERTLLVDLDGWSDEIRGQLGVNENPPRTIESYLDGHCAQGDTLRAVADTPNLDVAVSEGRRGGVRGLLQRQSFETYIGTLRESYDVVVLDAPPLLAVEDATTIAGSADAVVLVALCGRSSEDALREARDKVWLTNARLIGVLNGADPGTSQNGLRTSRAARRKTRRYFTE